MPPSRSYISDESGKNIPGTKMLKDRFTVLLGGNATGDLKLTPLLIHKYETPRALKNIEKSTLPVIYRHNRKGWMTCATFKDWYTKF